LNITEVLDILKQKIDEENIFINELISKHTSFKIGGPADIFIKIKNIENLKYVLNLSKEKNIPIYILGNGSNLLVKDKGIRGIVLKIELSEIEFEEAYEKTNLEENLDNKNTKNIFKVIVGSGVKLGFLAQKLAEKELTGFEELSGIPGTIGGAIKQNAGAHGKEIKDILEKVKVIDYDGNIITFKKEELDFSYRHSIFCDEKYIILEAEFKFEKGNKQEILNKMQEYRNWRKEKQPLEYPNAGSTFKRGEDFITAKLIDECGLKGYQIGGAQISEKHAGFIINKGNATAKDVIELIEYTKTKVKEKFDKIIELEVEIIGE